MPELQDVRLALTGTDLSVETARSGTAGATATGVRTGAIRSELVRHSKNKKWPWHYAKAVFQTRRTGLEPATTGSTVRDDCS
jgi:hypothetical protein